MGMCILMQDKCKEYFLYFKNILFVLRVECSIKKTPQTKPVWRVYKTINLSTFIDNHRRNQQAIYFYQFFDQL